MPLPMVHLLLANTIYTCQNKGCHPYFLLGSIAPDAIHARPGTNRLDKHKTHLFLQGHSEESSVEQHLKNVESLLASGDVVEANQWEFLKGYCVHTMLDMVWIHDIFLVLEKSLRSGGVPFTDVRTKYYEETNYCDALIFQKEKWVPGVQEILAQTEPLDGPTGLTANEIESWRNEVLQKMQGYKTYAGPVSHYITYPVIQKMVQRVSKQIIKKFEDWGYNL